MMYTTQVFVLFHLGVKPRVYLSNGKRQIASKTEKLKFVSFGLLMGTFCLVMHCIADCYTNSRDCYIIMKQLILVAN